MSTPKRPNNVHCAAFYGYFVVRKKGLPLRPEAVTFLMLCQHQSLCSGCTRLHEPYQIQKELKIKTLKPYTTNIEFLHGPTLGFRDRTDLTVHSGKIGFYDKNRSIFHLERCSLLSEDLHSAFQNFHPPEISKGSVRLRTSSDGDWGLWLDFSNKDIKSLLDSREWLEKHKDFVIEIGQKRKMWSINGRLIPAQMKNWFTTRHADGHEHPLKCYVSSFTQPSRQWNLKLLDRLISLANNDQGQWLEVGAGIGNFTVPLLTMGHRVTAIENDLGALECLQENTKNLKGLDIQRMDFRNIEKGDFDFALLDPPRSGLKSLAQSLVHWDLKKIFYVSCDLQSWIADHDVLRSKYDLAHVTIVDQFPHTDHMELLSVFCRR